MGTCHCFDHGCYVVSCAPDLLSGAGATQVKPCRAQCCAQNRPLLIQPLQAGARIGGGRMKWYLERRSVPLACLARARKEQ